MIFTELRFLVLFAACWLCFALFPRRWRAPVLGFWGALFYVCYAGRFLGVVLVLTLLAFLAGTRSLVAWLTGAGIVGLLLYFKLTAALTPLPATTATATVLVPLGFSYLSFELLHVIIERRRGKLGDLSLASLLAFVFFAPARISGPIKRYPQFVKAVNEATLSAENVYAGLLRVILGLAKKFLLADVLALTVAERSYVSTMGHAWVIVLAYSFQIYFDFSAYSDIAIGFARAMGIVLPENFRLPYLAPNIREFWDRWHITLSHWVRDYVFTPTGRRLFQTALRPWPVVIAAISYLVTFSIVGAWHGLTWAFLIWGLYHGAADPLSPGPVEDARAGHRAPALPVTRGGDAQRGRHVRVCDRGMGALPASHRAGAQDVDAAVRRRWPMKELLKDAAIAFVIAVGIVVLMLFASFNSTFIYRGF